MCTVTEISKHRSTPFVDMCTCPDAQTTARLFSKASNRRSFWRTAKAGVSKQYGLGMRRNNNKYWVKIGFCQMYIYKITYYSLKPPPYQTHHPCRQGKPPHNRQR